MITFYFIRHGQTIWNHSGRYQGITDVELSEKGKAQASRLVDYFAEIHLDAIYSSDLIRAIGTAAPLAQSKNMEINQREGLREINFGDWEGLTYDEINARWPGAIEHMYNSVTTVKIQNGQSFMDVQKASAKVLDEIIKKYPDGSVAIVSHGGTIRCMICHLLGLHLDWAWNLKQDNGNVTIVHYYGERNLLALLNDVHHLKNMDF